MYYKVCHLCGAHLDPGEICDCQQKKEKESESTTPEPKLMIRPIRAQRHKTPQLVVRETA